VGELDEQDQQDRTEEQPTADRYPWRAPWKNSPASWFPARNAA
jgi:hypothetical protein